MSDEPMRAGPCDAHKRFTIFGRVPVVSSQLRAGYRSELPYIIIGLRIPRNAQHRICPCGNFSCPPCRPTIHGPEPRSHHTINRLDAYAAGVRICLISYEFLPKTGLGGAAALYKDLSAALVRQGHSVTVLSGLGEFGTEIETGEHYSNVRFGSGRLSPWALAITVRAARVLSHLRRAERERGPFDVVESPELQSETLFINAFNKTCPVITRLVTPHFLLRQMNEKTPVRSVDWLERTNARMSKMILGDVRNWAEDILRIWNIDVSKLRICPLGIDLDRLDSAKEVPIDISFPYVLFAGRLTLAKGPQVLSAAAPKILRQHPETKIVFAGGDTPTQSGESVRELVTKSVPSDLREQILFKGFVRSWDELVSLYRNAAVCVKADAYTNHSYDTMGQMACGRPMVCTRNEAHADMIEDGRNGFLFERDSPDQLADIVNSLLSDPATCRSVGARGRRTIEERFTAQVCARETVARYEEAIRG